MPINGDTINADKLSGIDEESDIYEGFSAHVDRTQVFWPETSPSSASAKGMPLSVGCCGPPVSQLPILSPPQIRKCR